MVDTDKYEVKLVFKGKTCSIISIQENITVRQLESIVREKFLLSDGDNLKLLYKGKIISNGSEIHADEVAFPKGLSTKSIKIIVMSTSGQTVQEINSKRSDPTIRGFDNPKPTPSKFEQYWGPSASQNKNYKFCRFEACTWQSFGHRTGSTTPHAFAAMQLLEQLATDPGVVAIMIERELVVGTLGEMDPIDDRLMHKKKEEGACLLGYNTNAGARIDVKLRTDNLKGFRPYPEIVATLIHELSHNWVGEHNALFWTNYGQMRAEYIHKHATLSASGEIIRGKTSAQLAGVFLKEYSTNSIREFVLEELSREMASYHIPVELIAPAISDRCEEFSRASSGKGQALGGEKKRQSASGARELALAAAERRARDQKKTNEDK